MASLYRRKASPFFWIEWKDQNGNRHQESTRCRIGIGPDVRRARQLEAEKTLAELSSGAARRNEGWAWVSDFLNVRFGSKPPTLERYVCCWKTLQLFLKEKQIEGPAQLLRSHCFAYITWRAKPNKSKGKYHACHNTALLELKILRIIMQEALERSLVSGNPCVKLGIGRQKSKVKTELTAADCELIRAEIPKVSDPHHREVLRVSFEIARYQGCRLNETRLNPLTDVSITTTPDGAKLGTIQFQAKRGKEFTTRLHPKLIPLFEELKAEGKSTTWKPPANFGRQWASSLWSRFLDDIGLKSRGICFHSTRVTVVTELARNDVPEAKAMAYVGHASSTVHRIYQRLRFDDLDDCTLSVGGDTRPSPSTGGSPSGT